MGEPLCMPRQKAQSAFGLPRAMVSMMSVRGSSKEGSALKPQSSKKRLAKTAVRTAEENTRLLQIMGEILA